MLLTCSSASVPRYDSAFYLAMFEVRAKHFCQDTANSKNLTLCNQKHRLFLYLLGKCFAPTGVGRITREPDAVKGNRLSNNCGKRKNILHTLMLWKGLLHSPARGTVTIDMWWAVILNGAQRNEESLTSVATFEEILRCATIDIKPRLTLIRNT